MHDLALLAGFLLVFVIMAAQYRVCVVLLHLGALALPLVVGLWIWRILAQRVQPIAIADGVEIAAFVGMVVLTCRCGLVPWQFTRKDRRMIAVMNGLGGVGLATALLLAPPMRWLHSCVDLMTVLGLYRIALTRLAFRGAILIRCPFTVAVFVVQGGRGAFINHHYPIAGQRHALDLVALPDGDGGDEHLAAATMGQDLVAPLAGQVVASSDGMADDGIPTDGPSALLGNHLIIQDDHGRQVVMAHLQQGSITVAAGAMVAAGQTVARCGNSGNSTGPHLHLQINSGTALNSPTVPIRFGGVQIQRGRRHLRGDACDLRRNDLIVPDDRADPGPSPTRA